MPHHPEGLLKNVTIAMDKSTAAWVRVQAAKQNMSVSRFVGEILYQQMTGARAYDEGMRRFLGEEPLQFEWTDGRRPTREELHDRNALR
jgi:hypothetical protein